MARRHSIPTPLPSNDNLTEGLTPALTPAGKAAKPYEGFPLFPHQTGRWAKKIRGRLVYFGKVSEGWQAALEAFQTQRDNLYAGRKVREKNQDGFTLRDLGNRFWNHKKAQVDSGELSSRSFDDYERILDLIVPILGKHRLVSDLDPDDFAKLRAKMAVAWGPVTLANAIQRVRSVFKYAWDAGLVDRPVRFGPGFKRPSKRTMRLEKARKGKKLFTPEEIRDLLGEASPALRTMILLGINCGFGNSDCGTLPVSALALERGWIDYPRPKTGIERRCPLWPETIEAIREWLKVRPEPKNPDHAGLVFITKYGQAWAKDIPGNPISHEFLKVARRQKIEGRGFYCLRHNFQTIGDEARDPIATRHIMGHVDDSMSGVYREDVSDGRLKLVTNHVREWLFGNEGAGI